MTSFDPIHPKTGAIIELLAEHPALSTNDLFTMLRKKGMKHSKANFYKILAKMTEHQVLVKAGDMVSLNMVWAMHVHTYAAMMQKHAQETDITSFPPFKEGERRIFHGESLEKIDAIWTHLILFLFSQEKDSDIFVYESHPWYILGRPATERRMYESCVTQGKHMHTLCGNTSFLDRYGHLLQQQAGCTAFITDAPPFPKEGYNLWLCGNYIIECIFPPLIAQYFAGFFEKTTSAKEFDLKTFSSVFHIKVPAELHVSRDRKKAEKLRKLFLKHCEQKEKLQKML